MEILEIGSSSMLDNEFTRDWYKIYNQHVPYFGNYIALTDRAKLFIPDVAVITMGRKEKGRKDLSPSDLMSIYSSVSEDISCTKVWEACVAAPMNVLKRIIYKMKDSDKKILVIYINSISAEPYVPYPHQVDYAIAKSATGILLKNLSYVTDKIKVADVRVASVKSAMCDEGMDPRYVTKEIIKIIDELYNVDFMYTIRTIDKDNQTYKLENQCK